MTPSFIGSALKKSDYCVAVFCTNAHTHSLSTPLFFPPSIPHCSPTPCNKTRGQRDPDRIAHLFLPQYPAR